MAELAAERTADPWQTSGVDPYDQAFSALNAGQRSQVPLGPDPQPKHSFGPQQVELRHLDAQRPDADATLELPLWISGVFLFLPSRGHHADVPLPSRLHAGHLSLSLSP